MGARSPSPPSWFTRLCRTDSQVLDAPLPLRFAGWRWLFVCDGTAATALRGGSTQPVTFERARMARSLAPYFAHRGRSCRVASWVDIEAFLDGVSTDDKQQSPAFVAGGVAVNRCLLKRFLGPLKAARVKVFTGGEYDPVLFVTAEWIVLVMPRRVSSDELPIAKLFRDDGSVPLQHRALSSGALALPNRKTGEQ